MNGSNIHIHGKDQDTDRLSQQRRYNQIKLSLSKLLPVDLGNNLLAAFTLLNTFDDDSISRLTHSLVSALNGKLKERSQDYENVIEDNLQHWVNEDEINDLFKELGDNEPEDNYENDVLPMLQIKHDNEVSLGAAFRGAASAYLSTLRSNANGRIILKDVQHISEVLGFYLKITDSRYLNQHRAAGKDSCAILSRARFECQVTKHRDEKCMFDLKIATISFPRPKQHDEEQTVSESSGDENVWIFDSKVSSACHSHGPLNIPLKKYVRTKMKYDASHMYSILRINLDDVLKYLEDEYCFIDTKDLFKSQL